MSLHDSYKRESGGSYNSCDQRSHKSQKENFFGKMLGEVPIVSELFESFGGGRIGKKGIKKFCCCCAPIALILLIPASWLIYWLVKNGLLLFDIDFSKIELLEQSKNWLMGNLGLDYIGQWFGSAQSILGL